MNRIYVSPSGQAKNIYAAGNTNEKEQMEHGREDQRNT